MMRSHRSWLVILALVLWPMLCGCAPSVIDGGFDSPMPASKLYAIERAARNGDTTAVRNIIEQLDSDDPAVRMLAIGALERLTGQTFGYQHEAPRIKRREAIRRWHDAYEAGELTEIAREDDRMNRSQRTLPNNADAEGAVHG